MTSIAALIVALMSAQIGLASPRAGVMVASAGAHVVAVDGPLLSIGTPITVVVPDDPQEVFEVTIGARIADSDAMLKRNVAGPFYQVVAKPGSTALPSFAIAVVGRARVTRIGGAVSLRLAEPLVDVRVRSCTSSEGVHLTAWAGAPLTSRRLWHLYYYLGYDVEPNCRPEDYRDGG